MKTLHRIWLAVLLAFLSTPISTLADTSGGGGTTVIQNPLKGNANLFELIDTLIDSLLRLGAVLAVMAVIYAGFLFVTAAGDEKKITDAKKVLLYTLIGIAVLLGATLISEIIIKTVTDVGKATTG